MARDIQRPALHGDCAGHVSRHAGFATQRLHAAAGLDEREPAIAVFERSRKIAAAIPRTDREDPGPVQSLYGATAVQSIDGF